MPPSVENTPLEMQPEFLPTYLSVSLSPFITMIFINPKTDFAFKKIFGSEQSKDILISFLNALLYQGRAVIQDVEILNPYLAPQIQGIKDTYLDVKARITGDKTVIIEMQVLNLEGFEKRILYNAAKAYSIQLQPGEDYTMLSPVIALTITDFEMFEHLNQVISNFMLKEKRLLTDYPINDLELVFVELPKFSKSLEELETLTEQWIYFIKTARTLETIPETMAQVPEIRKAFEVANQANLTREELEALEQREIYIHDQRNAIRRALRQGKEETRREIAKQLLDVLDEETISRKTGLSLEEVRQFKIDELTDE